jgi:hypothetical protein
MLARHRAPHGVSQPAADPGGLLSKLMPELSVVATVLVALLVPGWLHPDALLTTASVDGATLMMSATVVDVASRLRRAPPWWLGAILVGGLLLLYPGTIGMLIAAWALGLWTFLPFAWSILERMRELWTLPLATPLEKTRRRTLTFDRLYTALVIGVVTVVAFVANSLTEYVDTGGDLAQNVLPWLMLAFYGVSAWNAWRVHQPGFEVRPRSLWPWIDGGQASYLDPI